MRVTRHRILARFGLMHMIGTNLSVWLNVLVQETKHEILTFYNPENNTIEFNHRSKSHSTHDSFLGKWLFLTKFNVNLSSILIRLYNQYSQVLIIVLQNGFPL